MEKGKRERREERGERRERLERVLKNLIKNRTTGWKGTHASRESLRFRHRG
jgi:hypothetical protein